MEMQIGVKNERDHRTFQMSNSLPQLRQIHYKSLKVSCTQLRCKTPLINIYIIISETAEHVQLQGQRYWYCHGFVLWCFILAIAY